MENKIKGSELFSNLLELSTIVNFNIVAGQYSQKYLKDDLIGLSVLFSKFCFFSVLYWDSFHNVKDFTEDEYETILKLIEDYKEQKMEIYEWEQDHGDVSNIFSEKQWKSVLENISKPKDLSDSEENKKVLEFWALDNEK